MNRAPKLLPLSCIICALAGCNATPKTAQEAPAAAATGTPSHETTQGQRFIPSGTNPDVALDTQKGTLCRAIATEPGATDKYVALPLCAEEGTPVAASISFAWDKAVHDTPLEASCYLTKSLLPAYSMTDKTKTISSGCIIQNRTDKEQPLIGATDYDAILLGAHGKMKVRHHASLASIQTKIPPHGKIEGGVWDNTECPSEKPANECLAIWLDGAKEVMIVTPSGETKAHLRMNRDSDPLGIL